MYIHAILPFFASACHGPTTILNEPRSPADVQPRALNITESSRPPRAAPTSASALQPLVISLDSSANSSASQHFLQRGFEQQTPTTRRPDSLNPAARRQPHPRRLPSSNTSPAALLLHLRRRAASAASQRFPSSHTPNYSSERKHIDVVSSIPLHLHFGKRSQAVSHRNSTIEHISSSKCNIISTFSQLECSTIFERLERALPV